MAIKKRALGVAMTLIASAALTGLATPAQASNELYLTICLSTASTPNNHPIHIYNEGKYDTTVKQVSIGQCKDVYDYDGSARVHIPWYDCYWIGQEGEGYGPEHAGPNYDSNPPSIGANGQYVKYKLRDANCI